MNALALINGLAPDQLATRQRLTTDEVGRLLASHALVVDDRRRRPLYFDGRFLAARDLTRDQSYFLVRQTDLARAGGAGVVDGLLASSTSTDRLHIEPGHGVTDSGELVILREAIDIDLADIPLMQRLDVTFGLSHAPREPTRTRSGLFILGLRAVEYTANPIAAYPTSLGGQRTVEDGDVIEATAVALVPYTDGGARNDLALRRAEVARAIFVDGARSGSPTGVLPLAMVALDRGHVSWLDMFLVRRDVDSDASAAVGFGLAPRAVRRAFVLQYEHQLQELLAQHDGAPVAPRFAASDYFRALPPVGWIPAAAINADTFTQTYFPPQCQVDLSIIPRDELAALVDEALELPPIDLTLGPDELGSTSLLIVVPVARAEFTNLAATLTDRPRPLSAPLSSQIAARLPIQSLRLLVPPRLPLPPVSTQSVVDAVWRTALGQVDDSGLLWYVRRRNVNLRADLTGINAQVTGPPT